MNKVDDQYQNILKDIIDNGIDKGDRTGTGTYSVFSREMRFDMQEGFPLLTTKKMYTRGIIHELLWFLNAIPSKYKKYGNTNIKYLVDHNVNIWTHDAYKAYKEKEGGELDFEEFKEKIKNDKQFALDYGDLGPIYGQQWRGWVDHVSKPNPLLNPIKDRIDQIGDAVKMLKKNPDSRRIIVSAWNVDQISIMTLPPCHVLFQFYSFVDKEGERNLCLKLFQRSCDMFLGVPFNIASYSLLLHMFAHVTDMKPCEFVWSGTDCHLYKDHIEQAKEQISRKPYELPRLKLNDSIYNIDGFKPEDIKIENYRSHKPIKASISV